MRIMSVFTSFGGLEKTGGFAQTIMMSTNPKVNDPWHCPPDTIHTTRAHRESTIGACCQVGIADLVPICFSNDGQRRRHVPVAERGMA